MEQRKTFVNELGNSIDVAVSKKEIDGVDGVLIYIAGPTSLTENHITKMEAQEIFQQLGEVLKD